MAVCPCVRSGHRHNTQCSGEKQRLKASGRRTSPLWADYSQEQGYFWKAHTHLHVRPDLTPVHHAPFPNSLWEEPMAPITTGSEHPSQEAWSGLRNSGMRKSEGSSRTLQPATGPEDSPALFTPTHNIPSRNPVLELPCSHGPSLEHNDGTGPLPSPAPRPWSSELSVHLCIFSSIEHRA